MDFWASAFSRVDLIFQEEYSRSNLNGASFAWGDGRVPFAYGRDCVCVWAKL